MAELTPYPFPALVRRMFRELDARGSIFDLPLTRCVTRPADLDWTARFHHHRASTPLGPAAGPQSQMAQNIVLSFVSGSRIMELKTVQIQDRLEIPRPCIDMQTVGYNVEWSQELRLAESLEEYVKGAMLVRMLVASGALPIGSDDAEVVYDMSVGYDLAGIRSAPVHQFIRGMLDASEIVERLRREIPEQWAHLRDLDFQTRLSDTLTLSTFHGCPPDEIERIIEHLLETHRLHCIVKLNPMLLGPERVRAVLHDTLGYHDVRVPDSAFERDTTWPQAVELADRLDRRAKGLGLGFGVKFTNTLIVENRRSFLPASAEEMYLSGQPLHVLAIELVRRWRRTFATRFPISFSAGIMRANFPDAVALGLVPVTVCTDLLRPRGYGRAHGYFAELALRMRAVGARCLDEYVIRAYGHGERALARVIDRSDERFAVLAAALESGAPLDAPGDETAETKPAAAPAAVSDPTLLRRWVAEVALANTETYAERTLADPRYHAEHNRKPPRKIGSELELFDCIACDKCVPVCPNDANFTLHVAPVEIPIVELERTGDSWRSHERGMLRVEHTYQYANFADFCNDCGNCDVFCPENGGPYLIKPRFFGSRAAFERAPDLDGFFVTLGADGARVDARSAGRVLTVVYEQPPAREASAGGQGTDRIVSGAPSIHSAAHVRFTGPGFDVSFRRDDPRGTIAGEASAAVDLTYFHVIDLIVRALDDKEQVNYVTALS